MDGENRKVVNGGASADVDTPGAFIPVEQPRQSQYFDVEEDVYEELTSPKETDGSEDKIKALEEEIQDLRHQIKEMERSEAGTRSLAARITQLERELARSEDNLVLISSKAKDAQAEEDSLRLIAKAMEADKVNLEARFRDLEARISDLKFENLKSVEDALRMEEVIKSLNMELDVEREKTTAAKNKEDDKVCKMEDELEKWKKELEMERDLVKEKAEEIAHLNEELVFAREKAKAEGIEKEKARTMTLQREYEINSLKEELKTTKEKPIDDVVNFKEKRGVSVARLEEENVSLKEELRLSRENERKYLEMEKKVASSLAEKEREVISLKQEMLLEREKVMDENEAENKEDKIFLVKEHLNEALVDARMREKNLEKEIKQLKDMNSELKEKYKGLQLKDNSDVLVRGTYLTEEERPKISRVSTAAIATSSGAIAAAITAFCLHHKK